ncbi:AsmA-like C-terminal region-containing protein [Sulfuriroseicoccus oceanibius]|uniref:Uncharacterized protein n=1 Tax=Sulfuriroseicoccus oceanibius TaxID=2707525 RepID=A0A6B3L5J5_9BACT|nr:AsmA-like C-terminal region-containing protein [Sulfuriroseicoccus oceanibius]QQL44220.1 hypothetical protein G3M56_009970 [Sulfuriroseicoccus oceanibius]
MPVSSLRWIKRVLSMVAVLLLLFGIWAGVYGASKGLTKKWRGMVQEEFHRHGISVSLRRLTLDPFHGLVAKDVRFYHKDNDEALIASMDRLALDVSLIALARDELFLNHIEVTEAQITIPLTPKRQRSKKPSEDGKDELRITGFNGRIHLDNHRISVTNAEGEALGIKFLLNGEFLHQDANDDGIPDIALTTDGGIQTPPDSSETTNLPEPGSDQWNESINTALSRLQKSVNLLRELEFPDGSPRLVINTKAELDALEEATVDFQLNAPAVHWRNATLNDLDIQATYVDGVASVSRCTYRDTDGEFDGELEFVRATKRLRFSLRSQTKLWDLITSAAPDLANNYVSWKDSPLLELAGELDCAQPITPANLPGQFEGLIACGKVRICEVPFDYVSFHFAGEGTTTFARSIKLRHASGLIEGDFLREDDRFKARAVVTAHPEELTCFAFGSRGVERFLKRFDCTRSSRVTGKLTGSGKFDDIGTWDLQAAGNFEDVRFNETSVSKASLHWQFLNREHIITQPSVRFAEEGTVTAGRIVHKPSLSLTEVTDLKGTVRPVTLLGLVAPDAAHILGCYEFSQPPKVTLDGVIASGLGRLNNFQATITTPGTAFIPVCGTPLPLKAANTQLHMVGNVLDIPTIKGTLLGGPLQANLTVDFASEATGMKGGVKVRNVDFSKLTNLYRDTPAKDSAEADGSEGQLTGHIEFSCDAGDPRSLNGEGVAAILNGNIFSLALFGPLSPLVEAALPEAGVGYSVAREATANFTIKDGVFKTDDFEALTPAFRMMVKGTVDCATQRLDMNARLNARGVAKVATILFSYIFEFKARGTIDDPKWKALHFTKQEQAQPLED